VSTVPRRRSAFGLLVLARLGGAALGILVQLALARMLGAQAFGAVIFAMSGATLGAALAVGGYSSGLQRFFARYRVRGRHALLSAYLRHAARSVLIGGACVILLALPAVLLASDPAMRRALLLAAPAVVFLAGSRLLGGLANVLRAFNTAFLPELVGRPVLMLALLAALWQAGMPLAAETAVTAFMLACGFQCALILACLWTRMPRAAPCRARPSLRRAWRRAALPLVPVSLFTGLFADLGILAAGLFLEPDDLAVFGVCLKTAMLVGFAVQLAQQLALPDIAEALAQQTPGEARARLRAANGVALAATLAALAGAAILGPFYLSLFGPRYAAEGGALLLILVAAQAARAWFGPGIQVLALSGRGGRAALACLVALAGFFGLMAALTPPLGPTGAALAAAATTVAASALAALLASRGGSVASHGCPSLRPLLRHCFAGRAPA